MKRLLVCAIFCWTSWMFPMSGAGEDTEGIEVLYEQPLERNPYQIGVPATIAGKTYFFILDTGTTANVFDVSLQNSLVSFNHTEHTVTVGQKKLSDLQPDSKPAPLISHDLDLDIYDAPPIAIGKWNLPAANAWVFDFAQFRSLRGRDIRGIIGMSSLENRTIYFDFDRQRLRIAEGAAVAVSNESIAQLQFTSDKTPTVTVDIAGRKIVFVLDSGDSDDIHLATDEFDTLVAAGNIVQNETTPNMSVSAFGIGSFRSGHFVRGNLLGVDLKGVSVAETNMASDIGMGFLSNFNFALDFKSARLLYHHRNASSTISTHEMLGGALKYEDSGRNHVFVVDPTGAFRDAGIRIWDHVLRLGSLREADLEAASVYRLCYEHPGEDLDVEIERPGEAERVMARIHLPERKFTVPPQ